MIARIISRSIGRMGITIDFYFVLVLFFLPVLLYVSCIFSLYCFHALENKYQVSIMIESNRKSTATTILTMILH